MRILLSFDTSFLPDPFLKNDLVLKAFATHMGHALTKIVCRQLPSSPERTRTFACISSKRPLSEIIQRL
jgi:hypothetical protein